MKAECAKKGCRKDAVGPLVRITDRYRTDVYPAGLCEEHLKAAQKIEAKDVSGLIKWLNAEG